MSSRLIPKIQERIRFQIYLPFIQLIERLLDGWNRIETTANVEIKALQLSAGQGHRYEGTPTRHLGRILRDLNLQKEDVFLDYGSGKGRVLINVAKRQVGRVIGLEISPELVAICEGNIKQAMPKLKCLDLTVKCANGADWPVPDDCNVLFFFNPFPDTVLENV